MELELSEGAQSFKHFFTVSVEQLNASQQSHMLVVPQLSLLHLTKSISKLNLPIKPYVGVNLAGKAIIQHNIVLDKVFSLHYPRQIIPELLDLWELNILHLSDRLIRC